MLSFHIKFVQTDGQTDGRTDGWADNGKTVCPPIFQYGGIKITQIIGFTRDWRESPIAKLPHKPLPHSPDF